MKERTKKIIQNILTGLLVFLFVFCAAAFIAILSGVSAKAITPSITVICNSDGYTFTGDEWTIVEIDERVLNRFSTADTKQIPYLVEQYVKEKGLEGVSTVVDDDGRLVFEVNEATYLLYRSNAVNKSFTSSPILVTVPEKINGESIYNIEITAKFASSTSTDAPKPGTNFSEKVLTGDSTIIWTIVIAWLIAGVGIILLIAKKKKGDHI